jgi:hypothetical protein
MEALDRCGRLASTQIRLRAASSGRLGGVTLTATYRRNISSNKSGIFIGNARVFYVDWVQNGFFYAPCDFFGRITGNPTPINTAGNVPQDSPNAPIVLHVERAADGTFLIQYSAGATPSSIGFIEPTGASLPALAAGTQIQSGFWGETAAKFGTDSPLGVVPIGQLTCGYGGCGCLAPPTNWQVTIPAVSGNCCTSAVSGTYECTPVPPISNPNGLCEWTFQVPCFLQKDGTLTGCLPPCPGPNTYNAQGFVINIAMTRFRDGLYQIGMNIQGSCNCVNCAHPPPICEWQNNYLLNVFTPPGLFPCQDSYVLAKSGFQSPAGACDGFPDTMTITGI